MLRVHEKALEEEVISVRLDWCLDYRGQCLDAVAVDELLHRGCLGASHWIRALSGFEHMKNFNFIIENFSSLDPF